MSGGLGRILSEFQRYNPGTGERKKRKNLLIICGNLRYLRMKDWLTTAFDENFRGYAAEALGNVGTKQVVPLLEQALKVEPFPWVQNKITAALEKIK